MEKIKVTKNTSKTNLLLSIAICAVVVFVLVFTLTFSPQNQVLGNPTNYVETPQIVTGTIDVSSNEMSQKTPSYEMVEAYQYAAVSVIIRTSGGAQASMGSGIAVYNGGYIATNWHVISSVESNPSEYSVNVIVYEGLGNGEGIFTEYPAKLLWSNINFDLAIVKCEKTDLPYVKMSNRWINLENNQNRLRISEEIWTLGSPYDSSLQGTFTKGTISSECERVSSSSNRIYESLIQHDASISNGSSGSGLFDMNGNLIGLNTLGVTSSSSAANDIYFATPIYPIINIISKIATLEEDGNAQTNYKLPTIGITGYDSKLSEYYGYTFSGVGVYVQEVTKNGACFGKLNAGDAIIGLSISVASSESDEGYFAINKRNDLLYALSNFNTGDMIKLYVKRGEQTLSFEIVLS